MNEAGFQERMKRVMSAVSLSEGDRVPFIPSMNNFYALHYGVTIQDAMTNCKNLTEAVKQYTKDYDPDVVYSPGAFFPIAPMETAGYQNAKWPGSYWNLPQNTPYQYIDKSFLGEDDYDTYLKDPSAYLIQNVLPGKYKNFQGLRMLNIPGLCGQSILSMAALGLPPVQETLKAMMTVGQQVQDALHQSAEVVMQIVEMGYPVYGDAVASMAFDDFADNVRGLLDTCMDIVADPEPVHEAMTRWGDATIPAAVALAKMTHQDFAFIPLHCGTDDFMSKENYMKYYWPHLKRLITAYVDAGITPFVFCEGKYNTRLDIIADVPKGKVVYFFENTDMKEAKRILGNTACISGAFPSQLLMEGHKPEEVERKVQEMMDSCAAGGGFIMSNSLALDNADPRLMHAWREATEKYGTY
ncbi:MAG: uroporphyrinogen decarboxylase family protein [Lachnospiraceae bacterium]